MHKTLKSYVKFMDYSSLYNLQKNGIDKTLNFANFK